MKLKILLKIVEMVLGTQRSEDTPQADMYLPDRLLAMGLIFSACGTACAVFAVFHFALWAVVCAALGIVLGIFALLCWRNQSIHVISDEKFTYTTMFGRKRTYSFSDIQNVRQNSDSMTLFVANEKVHIESMAVLSDRHVDLINKKLSQENQ